jgi:CheY-like chemotaxis protein
MNGKPRRILLVDDNRVIRATLRTVLEMMGHRVEEAVDGPGAVEAAARFDPEVALVDLSLPGFDGFEVARRIRSQAGRNVLLVCVTGHSQPEQRQKALESGFDLHLVKPVSPDRLLDLVAQG